MFIYKERESKWGSEWEREGAILLGVLRKRNNNKENQDNKAPAVKDAAWTFIKTININNSTNFKDKQRYKDKIWTLLNIV